MRTSIGIHSQNMVVDIFLKQMRHDRNLPSHKICLQTVLSGLDRIMRKIQRPTVKIIESYSIDKHYKRFT